MRSDKNAEIKDHFEKLKEILPEVYHPRKKVSKTTSDKLFAMLKSSLSVIEAVYLQHPQGFSEARLEAYSTIVEELRAMGVKYSGNEEILSKAANKLLMDSKKPMERAGTKKDQSEERRAI